MDITLLACEMESLVKNPEVCERIPGEIPPCLGYPNSLFDRRRCSVHNSERDSSLEFALTGSVWDLPFALPSPTRLWLMLRLQVEGEPSGNHNVTQHTDRKKMKNRRFDVL